MAQEFDVVILGGGPGGYAAALYGAAAGLSIGMIEEARVGGTCLHQGCIPAKELLQTAEVLRTVAGAKDYGVDACQPTLDLRVSQTRKTEVIERLTKGLESTLKGRKIVHHAIAYLVLNNDPDAVNTGTASGRRDATAPDDLVDRRPQLMEWAIGKGYDQFREGTGKLLLPGEKISWDEHIHAVGEEITDSVELGIWFYPKGETPKYRTYLTAFPGTPLYARLLREGRILRPGRWELCTLFDVNYEPKGMTPQQLRDGLYRLAGELYSAECTAARRRPFFEARRKLPA